MLSNLSSRRRARTPPLTGEPFVEHSTADWFELQDPVRLPRLASSTARGMAVAARAMERTVMMDLNCILAEAWGSRKLGFESLDVIDWKGWLVE